MKVPEFTPSAVDVGRGYTPELMAGLAAKEKKVLVTLHVLPDKALDRLTAHLALGQDMLHSTWGFKDDGSPGDVGCLIAVSMTASERYALPAGDVANLTNAYDSWGATWNKAYAKTGVDVNRLAKKRLYELVKREYVRRHPGVVLGEAPVDEFKTVDKAIPVNAEHQEILDILRDSGVKVEVHDGNAYAKR